MRLVLVIASLLLLLLIGCKPDANSQPNLHEISLYKKDSATRYSYFYGPPSRVIIGDVPIDLQESLQNQQRDNLAVPGALYANGKPYLARSLFTRKAPFEIRRYRYSSDILLSTNEPLEEVLYYDGQLWFTLTKDSNININSQVVPQERFGGLEGVSELTKKEANMLEQYFASLNKPVALALLSTEDLPKQSFSGFNDYRHTAFFVQVGVNIEEESLTAKIQTLNWDFLGLGNEALAEDNLSFVIVRNDTAFSELWLAAHRNTKENTVGSITGDVPENPTLLLPKRPIINFSSETVLAIFLGVKNELGYSIDVDSVTLEDGEVYADVKITTPSSLIKNEAHISPWLMIRVFQPNIEVIWIRNSETGELMGVAKSK